ncbi:MAG: hypothetical protein RIS76_3210 [Verrucomicrobiota bacterium]|jgi:hypothetical protein
MKRVSSQFAHASLSGTAAPGPAKEAWKADGNRYTAEQLRAMSRAARDELILRPTTIPVRRAD